MLWVPSIVFDTYVLINFLYLRYCAQKFLLLRKVAPIRWHLMAAQLAIVNEGAEGYMLGIGKSLLAFGEVDTLEESFRKINAVTASEIMEVANEVWREPSVLLYK